jgi:hypothetical protein
LVQAARVGDQHKYPELLRHVAEEGYDLYKDLFYGSSAQIDRDNAKRVRDWIATRPSLDSIITFAVPSGLHIPWGLIYDQPPTENINPNNFWCLKFKTTAQYSEIPPEGTDLAWPENSFPLLFGAHEPLWGPAYGALDDCEKVYLNGLLGYPAQPKFHWGDLQNLWEATKEHSPHGLLSLYCHGTSEELLVGRRLSAEDFERDFAREELQSQPPTLVLLAACRTAIGDLHGGFLQATSGPGYAGFIGTEVKVPDIFTLRFVVRFLERFFRTGENVRDAMYKLRIDHWPLSLVFSICCTGDLRLAPDSKKARNAMKHVNLSNERTSTAIPDG